MDDAIGAENPEWLICVDYDAGLNLIARLFKKRDAALQLQICDAINRALKSEPEIGDVRWCNGEGTDCDDRPG